MNFQDLSELKVSILVCAAEHSSEFTLEQDLGASAEFL